MQQFPIPARQHCLRTTVGTVQRPDQPACQGANKGMGAVVLVPNFDWPRALFKIDALEAINLNRQISLNLFGQVADCFERLGVGLHRYGRRLQSFPVAIDPVGRNLNTLNMHHGLTVSDSLYERAVLIKTVRGDSYFIELAARHTSIFSCCIKPLIDETLDLWIIHPALDTGEIRDTSTLTHLAQGPNTGIACLLVLHARRDAVTRLLGIAVTDRDLDQSRPNKARIKSARKVDQRPESSVA